MNQLSKKAENITVNNIIADYIKKNFKKDFEIVGPDEESYQWSKSIADILKKEVIILKKERFGDRNVKIKNQKLENKKIIIIDDIISTGKTISETLKIAKNQGIKDITCIGIHGVLVKGADKLITKHAKLITTNSIPNKYSKIDISPAIIQALKKYS